jgi:hypothetical protein
MRQRYFVLILVNLYVLLGQINYNEEFTVYKGDYSLYHPYSTFLENGSLVICWEKNNIYAKIYNSELELSKNKFRVNEQTGRIHTKPLVFPVSEDRFVIGWHSKKKSGEKVGLVMQVFSNSGKKIGSEIIKKSLLFAKSWEKPYAHRSFSFASLDNGKFIVIFEGEQIIAQIIDKNGNKLGGEFQINSWSGDTPKRCNVAKIAEDKFIATWDGYADNNNVYARLFNFDKEPLGKEFPVNVKYNGINRNSKIVKVSDQKFLVTWVHRGDEEGIYGQFFDSQGKKWGDIFLLRNMVLPEELEYYTASLQDGKVILSWKSGKLGMCQIYTKDGEKFEDEFVNNRYGRGSGYADFVAPVFSINNTDKFITTWNTGNWYSNILKAKCYLSHPIEHQLSEFNLISPENNAELDTTNPALVWNKANTEKINFPWEVKYDIYLSETQNSTHRTKIGPLLDTTYYLPPLKNGQSYYWEVEAKSWNGVQLWSSTENKFTINELNHDFLETEEYLVDTTSETDQADPAIAALSNNEFVIGWIEFQNYEWGSYTRGKSQIFNNDMSKISNQEIIIPNGGFNLKIAPLPNSTYVANWEHLDAGTEINMNIVDGQNQNIKIVDYATFDNSTNGGSIKLSDTRFVTCYSSWSGIKNTEHDNFDIYFEIFSNHGETILDKTMANTYTENSQDYPAVASFPNGDFIITWQSQGPKGFFDIYAQRFDSTGTKIGNEFMVNTYTENHQVNPHITYLFKNKMLIVWESSKQDSSKKGIFGQILGLSGNKINEEFRINSYSFGDQKNPVAINRSKEGFVVCWQSTNQDGNGEGVFMQIFNNDGGKIGNEIRVNTETAFDQSNPSITSLNNGDVVICWQSNAPSGDDWYIIAKKLPCNYTSVSEVSTELNDYILYHNYPNPFNSSTTISYYIPKSSDVKLAIYDLQGRKIKNIIDKQIGAGIHKVNFNASGLPSGIYFYKLQVGNDYTKTSKMMLLK